MSTSSEQKFINKIDRAFSSYLPTFRTNNDSSPSLALATEQVGPTNQLGSLAATQKGPHYKIIKCLEVWKPKCFTSGPGKASA